jgi:hypothetical protein
MDDGVAGLMDCKSPSYIVWKGRPMTSYTLLEIGIGEGSLATPRCQFCFAHDAFDVSTGQTHGARRKALKCRQCRVGLSLQVSPFDVFAS